MWFESYLTNRSQRVVLDGYTSLATAIPSGVPQGLILGPLLFILAMNPLTDLCLSSSTRMILYADDILVYKPMKGHLDGDALQNDVNIIVNWINSTGLKLNPTKTRLMVLSRKPHPSQPHIVVAGSSVMQVTSLKYLGVTIFQPVMVDAYRQHVWRSQETTGLALPTFPPCRQGDAF